MIAALSGGADSVALTLALCRLRDTVGCYANAAIKTPNIDRLAARGFVTATANEQDARHRVIALTAAGENFVRNATQAAHRITAETLAPLSPDECAALLALLKKIS